MSLSFNELSIELTKYSYVIFDLDGTLYNEFEYRKIAFGEAISAVLGNSDKRFQDIYLSTIKKYKENSSSKNIFDKVFMDNNINKDYLPIALNAYRNADLTGMKKIKSHKKDLERIARSGKIIYLVTNGRTAIQKKKIRALGIENIFSKIVICDSEIGMPIKPSKKVFSLLKLNNINKIVMVGDSSIDRDFAFNSKIEFLHYKFAG